MSIHVQTGNRIDVVYDYDRSGKQRLLGIQPHSGDLISVPDPIGLAEVLIQIAKECSKV